MFFIVYKITHKQSGKFYVGMHRTKNLDDGYMGSGKLIKRAIDKYGVDQFDKEILHIFDNEDEMIRKEKDLVTRNFCLREDTYNIKNGGKGGWNHIKVNGMFGKKQSKKQRDIARKTIKTNSERWIKSEKCKKHLQSVRYDWKGKKHTDETKRKMSESSKGKGLGKSNSQYGTMWITNGTDNRKIKKIDLIPEGWYKGRVTNIMVP